ncbi:MAG: DUF1499 domain-containing protein [Pararhodobacter sp.]
MSQILIPAALALALAFAGFAVWVRLAPSDPARWHLDPATAPRPSTPNWAEVDRVVAASPETVARQIDERARAEGAVRLAEDDGFTTWIARTRLMRYPDYVSIRLTPEGEGTRIRAFSRSRFGYGDGGVNRARLRRWLPD